MQLIIPTCAISRIANNSRMPRRPSLRQMLAMPSLRAEWRRLFFLLGLLGALVVCIASLAL